METFDFISSIGWRFAFRLLQKQISGISNKMFTQTVELEKDGLISRKVFPVVPRIQIKRERKIARSYFLRSLDTCEAAHENAQRHRQLSCHGRR
jgi:DNA-binding HxlR family transcriptional regulator